jgi:Rieske Fe-S protein
MTQPPETYSRRNWLLYTLGVCITGTVGVLLYPVGRFLRPRVVTGSGALEVVAPYRVSDLKPDAEGHWPGPFEFNGKPCLLVRTPAGEIRAFNAICTHVGCTVEFRSAEGDIFCNCHDGVFNLNGQNVSGPPPRPLQQYKVTIRPTQTPGQEEIVVSRST